MVFYQIFNADSWLIKAAKVPPKNLQCKRYKISNASPCLKPPGNSWICLENSLRQSSIRERQLVCSTRLIRPGPSISGRILLAANFSCFAIALHPSSILNIYHNIILTIETIVLCQLNSISSSSYTKCVFYHRPIDVL